MLVGYANVFRLNDHNILSDIRFGDMDAMSKFRRTKNKNNNFKLKRTSVETFIRAKMNDFSEIQKYYYF